MVTLNYEIHFEDMFHVFIKCGVRQRLKKIVKLAHIWFRNYFLLGKVLCTDVKHQLLLAIKWLLFKANPFFVLFFNQSSISQITKHYLKGNERSCNAVRSAPLPNPAAACAMLCSCAASLLDWGQVLISCLWENGKTSCRSLTEYGNFWERAKNH